MALYGAVRSAGEFVIERRGSRPRCGDRFAMARPLLDGLSPRSRRLEGRGALPAEPG